MHMDRPKNVQMKRFFCSNMMEQKHLYKRGNIAPIRLKVHITKKDPVKEGQLFYVITIETNDCVFVLFVANSNKDLLLPQTNKVKCIIHNQHMPFQTSGSLS